MHRVDTHRSPLTPQAPAMGPREALHRAVQSLESGPADPRSVEGAKINALESIAWSLIGLLGERVNSDGTPHSRLGNSAQDSLTGELRNILGVNEPSQ